MIRFAVILLAFSGTWVGGRRTIGGNRRQYPSVQPSLYSALGSKRKVFMDALVRQYSPELTNGGADLSPGGGKPLARNSLLTHLAGPTTDVTLATQLSMDRMWLLEGLCSRWGGNIVAAIFVPSGSNATLLTQWDLELSRLYAPRLKTVMHHAVAETIAAYPVNRLRNIAIKAVKTSHFFMVDVDMWPSIALHGQVLAALRNGLLVEGGVLREHPKRVALVVPTFELKSFGW